MHLFLVILLFGLPILWHVFIWLIFGALPYLSQLGNEGGSLSENILTGNDSQDNRLSCMQHI